ncbi:hypothetical protein [Halomarina oriensis]|uniref:Uncharacterized protein n=1 Tax=Halomarina oriensis TaxID=671145 RepID=A0A6B0GPM4_9EURY|nr:hypothetical protein [Halomarina oriensis]MWG33578.1 hypothetical protein [Halomarina oriensis]
MRSLIPTLVVASLLLLAGCVGSPVESSEPTTQVTTERAHTPSQPDRPSSVNSESVAAYANQTETYRIYSEATADGASDVEVTCAATTVGFTGDDGYAVVACSGTVHHGSSTERVDTTVAYRVSTSDETRIDRVSTHDDGSDNERRFRVYNFGDDRRSLAVTVTPADGGAGNASTVYEYRLDGESGAATTGLVLDSSTDRYDVTVTAGGSSRLSTRWTTTDGVEGDGPVGVVVVAPDGELVWGTAPA